MKLGEITQPLIRLLTDASEAEELLETNDTQFIRRAYIRSLFSSTEGIIWLMKQTCLKLRPPNLKISIADYAILSDESYELKDNGETFIQTKFLKLPDNLRFTVKIVNQLFHSELDLEVGTKKWADFKDAVKIRNRITHPRNAAEIDISDDEISLCKDVSSWFNHLIHKFVKSLLPPSSTTTKIEEAAVQE